MPYLPLNTTAGVTSLFVPSLDDGSSSAIPVPAGFPIGNDRLFVAYVSYLQMFVQLISIMEKIIKDHG